MTLAVDIASLVLLLVWITLLARVVLSFVFSFARDWKPRGFAALAVETVYSVTDPLIKPVRKVLPPVSVGAMRFDVAFLAVFIAVGVLRYFLLVLRASLA